jgi:hypothetical protein
VSEVPAQSPSNFTNLPSRRTKSAGVSALGPVASLAARTQVGNTAPVVRAADEERVVRRHGDDDVAVDLDLPARPELVGQQQARFETALGTDTERASGTRSQDDLRQKDAQIVKGQTRELPTSSRVDKMRNAPGLSSA